jgi:hypothetical protein
MARVDKVRARRVAVEALGISWAPLLLIGAWHASEYHPVSIPLMVGYVVVSLSVAGLYIYLAYVRRL